MTTDDSEETLRLLHEASAGDAGSWGHLLERHRERLRRFVSVRLDPRLRGRVGPDDVLQEAFLAALAALPGYLSERRYPFFLWLRGITSNKLLATHRFHLGTDLRDATREVPLQRTGPGVSSENLARHLLCPDPSPGAAAAQHERCARLQEILERLSEDDREALVLRHYEQLTTPEIAQVLGVSEAAAAKRYLRALSRLRELMKDVPGGGEGLLP